MLVLDIEQSVFYSHESFGTLTGNAAINLKHNTRKSEETTYEELHHYLAIKGKSHF